MKIQDLTNALRVARDAYKDNYQSSINKKLDNEAALRKNYVSNSRKYIEEKKRIEDVFNNEVDAHKSQARESVKVKFSEIREAERKRVQTIDDIGVNRLMSIANIPIYAEELEVLNGEFGHGKNYWTGRVIASIAEKNGIAQHSFDFGTGYSDKIAILDYLEKQFDKLLDAYNGDCNPQIDMLLHDTILVENEGRYTGGFENIFRTHKELAYRALTLAKSKTNELDRCIVIHNVIKTSDRLTKCEFIRRLLSDNLISRKIIFDSGCEDEIRAFEKQEQPQYEEAKEIMEHVRKARTRQEVSAALSVNGSNAYIADMLKEEAKQNQIIAEYLASENV